MSTPQVKNYLLMLFYHVAADVKAKVSNLCNSPAMKTLFRMFGDVIQQCNNMLATRRDHWFKNFLNRGDSVRLWSQGPLSMLCLEECKSYFRSGLLEFCVFRHLFFRVFYLCIGAIVLFFNFFFLLIFLRVFLSWCLRYYHPFR